MSEPLPIEVYEQFRQASLETNRDAKYPKGKPADPTSNMSDEQKAEWKKQNEANRDKFKSASVKSEALGAVMALGQDSEQVAGLLYNLLLQWQYGPGDVSEDFGRLTHSLHGGLLPAPPRSVLQKALRAVSTPASMAEFLSVALNAVGEQQLAAKSQQLIRMAGEETDEEAKFEKGKSVPLSKLPGDLQDNAKNPPPAVQKVKDKMKGKKGQRQRLSWDVEAAGGLYGFTKGTQRDVEASVRKIQKQANKIARAAWGKDERVAGFLTAHAKRANSLSARILVAAFKDIGPKTATDKTAGSGAVNAKYLDGLPSGKKNKILKHVAQHYGVSVSEIEGELKDRDAENLFEYTATDRAMTMEIYNDFKRQRLMASTTAEDKTARVKSKRESMGMMNDLRKKHGGSTKAYYEAVLKEVKAGVIAPSAVVGGGYKDGKKQAIKWLGDQMKSAKTAAEDKTAEYGCYGHRSKTATLGMNACSELRGFAGRTAHGLHTRRESKYDKITGFLDAHCKSARCRVSKLMLSTYPDRPTERLASTEVKTASVPEGSVDDWLAWED